MRTNLVEFTLRRVGSSLLFAVEPVSGGPQGFVMHGVQVQRLHSERDILKALELAQVGRWSSFPTESIQATVTRDQLWGMGFSGNY
jgi:hypothetical protein